MSTTVPETVTSLLNATNESARAAAWAHFLETYNGIILRAAGSLGGDHDARMDRYAFVVEHLQRDGHFRLRQYVADGRGQFTTWLVIVVQRLCLDEHRRRYGRQQAQGGASDHRQAMRRRLTDLITADLDLTELPDAERNAEATVQRQELHAALDHALAAVAPRDRVLLKLRFEDGCSVPEIAKIMGFQSVGHAYRRLEFLFSMLRERLKASGVDSAEP